jgi:hypothetical protein
LTDIPHSSLRRLLRFNRASYALLSGFVLIVGLILYVWQPLVREYLALFNPAIPLWRQVDWLLIGIFAFMTLAIMAGADLRRDARTVLVGTIGGLVIEAWGTQTLLWTYYTAERPPLWIIPAWPIASLTIDRLARLADRLLPGSVTHWLGKLYWLIFPGFYLLMLVFIRPTLDKSLTWMALLTCAVLTVAPGDRRLMTLNFIAGAGLGYFLERWGTTRECWTYYTLQTPPLFAVLAHGLAAAAFWRAREVMVGVMRGWTVQKPQIPQINTDGDGSGIGGETGVAH